ncbi:MAG: PKD domain-containing protein, partial [Chitinophagaceae bacterium]
MKKLFLLTAFYSVLLNLDINAQDFSNKGRDFWVGYGLHCRMFTGNSGGTQEMLLYFATDAVTTVKVEIPSLGYSRTYSNIPANTIFTTNPLPKTGSSDARLTSEGVSDKGIHITSDKNIVAYAHIYNNNVSGATLLFPTNTLGKEYYSINFEQHSNEAFSNAFFYAVATDTGTTTIEVIPSANTQNMTAGNTYTFNLKQGQVFNALGQIFGNDGVDLTGSKIRSISSANGQCKKIAVFSGSGKIHIKCPLGPGGFSADNYMVQAFPQNAWGKYYLTVPTKNFENNFFRIGVSDPSTVVKMNGAVMTGLINNFYYHVGTINTPNVIEADKPIMVAQYITTQGTCSNGSIGDPEIIYLSPVEQNIDKVILSSTANFAINSNLHFINVVIPNGGTAISSFKIDGLAPSASFTTHPGNNNYSFLQQPVTPGQHIVQSDSGFNAIAYGYGNAESYGYNAGANVKDLYQFVSIKNEFATVNFPAGCKGSPFNFSMTFPYQPTQIDWKFNGLFADVSIPSPVYDSTWMVNGKQLYRYKLPASYSINNIGTYPIKVIAQNPTPDGCGNEQEITYDLQIFERPSAAFNFVTNGCITDSIRFSDQSSGDGRNIIRWSWNFNDGNSSDLKTPAHLFKNAAQYNVRLSVITDIGCLSDTVEKQVILSELPLAKFTLAAPNCVGKPISFVDASSSTGSTLAKWYWDFGDGSPQIISTSSIAQSHVYNSTGTYFVKLKVETATGCQSVVYMETIEVKPNPLASFNFSAACLPLGSMQFTNTSTISDGTATAFTYQWNFGDGGQSASKDPSHNYANQGPFRATLTVTSSAGCIDDTTNLINTIYTQPQALFTAPAEICEGNTISFTDKSTAPNSSVAKWLWTFGDGTTSALQNPSKVLTPGLHAITLDITSAIGCNSNTFSGRVMVNALPIAAYKVSAVNCVNKDITFSDFSNSSNGNITKWTWNFGDGTTLTKNNNLPFAHRYSSTGSKFVSLQVETDKGCVSSVLESTLSINPLPVPSFTMPGNCLADPFSQFTNSSKIADASESAFTYSWNFGDPNAGGSNSNISNLKDPKHKYSVVGPYNVSLTVTSKDGCASDTTQIFVVNGSVPQSGFSVQGGNEHCSNNSISLKNNSSVDVGRIVKLEVFWDANDPSNKTTDNDPQPGKIYTLSYPEFFTPGSKDYTIRVRAYSGDLCFEDSIATITLHASPQLQFGPISSLCGDVTPVQLKASAINISNIRGDGFFTGKGISPTGLFNPSIAGAGIHTIKYSFTTDKGCINTEEEKVEVFKVPTANAGPDRVVLKDGIVTLSGSATAGLNLRYLWTPDYKLNNNSTLTPIASPEDDFTYTLT